MPRTVLVIPTSITVPDAMNPFTMGMPGWLGWLWVYVTSAPRNLSLAAGKFSPSPGNVIPPPALPAVLEAPGVDLQVPQEHFGNFRTPKGNKGLFIFLEGVQSRLTKLVWGFFPLRFDSRDLIPEWVKKRRMIQDGKR